MDTIHHNYIKLRTILLDINKDIEDLFDQLNIGFFEFQLILVFIILFLRDS